jgi:hypothetical protein
MKAEFTKFGPKHDYRNAIATLEYKGQTLIGRIKNVSYDATIGAFPCDMQHMNGEEWPIRPTLGALEILEVTY